MTHRIARHRSIRAAAVLVGVPLLALLAGCGGSTPEGAVEDQPYPPLGPTKEEGVRVSVDEEVGPILVIEDLSEGVNSLLADDRLRQGLLDAAFGGNEDRSLGATVFDGGLSFLIEEPLPDVFSRNPGVDCTQFSLAAIDEAGGVISLIPLGTCGMEHTQLAVEFGEDGVEVADRRFIDDPPVPAEPGTVAVDRLTSRGFLPGEAVDVALDPVREEDIAPSSDGRVWPPLRSFVCFDVTVRSGAAAPDGQVAPAVSITEGGAQFPIPEPTDQFRPRVIAQEPDTNVVWSFGPIDLDEHQPDSVTVTAAEGEIVSWDVSARHC